MPYVEPRRNQNGEITSYRLVVSAGLDQNGKQIRRRSLWTPPTRGMSEAQMEREATAAAYKFEDQIKKGYNFDNNQTFAEYAQYVLELKERTGVKTSTMDRYLDMLPRINEAIGHLKICNIRPQHLNDFYKYMTENAVRSDSARAIAKRTLLYLMKPLSNWPLTRALSLMLRSLTNSLPTLFPKSPLIALQLFILLKILLQHLLFKKLTAGTWTILLLKTFNLPGFTKTFSLKSI